MFIQDYYIQPNHPLQLSSHREDGIEELVEDFVHLNIFSSVKSSPQYFTKHATTYRKEIEDGINTFLGSLKQPTTEDIDTLINRISEGKTSIRFDSTAEEPLKFLSELAQTKTGYYVISRAIKANSKIYIKISAEKARCKTTDLSIKDFFDFLVKVYLFFLLYPITLIINRDCSIIKYFDINRSEIYIKNEYNMEITSLNSQGTIAPSPIDPKMVLLHELTHTFDRNKLPPAFQHLTYLDQMNNLEEMKAIMYENALYSENGMEVRRISHKPYDKWASFLHSV